MKTRIAFTALALMAAAHVNASRMTIDDNAREQQSKDPHAIDKRMPPPVATFSILGYDPETGEVGGAVQSRVFTLTGVLTADADAGVVATQAIVDVSYGPKGIALLKQGLKPEAIIRAIYDSDPDPVPDTWTKEGR